jgi:hypothetical protein
LKPSQGVELDFSQALKRGIMTLIYGDFDISDLWRETEYARKNYIGEPLTDELVADYRITLLAPNFETFVRGLKPAPDLQT